jgi:hypothetical protein
VPDPLYNDFFASFFGVPNDGIYNFTDHLKTRDESAGSVDGGPTPFPASNRRRRSHRGIRCRGC